MNKWLLSSLAVVAIACNNSPDEKAMSDSPVVVKTGESPNRCYAYLGGRDTVRMQLSVDGKAVTGDLTYHLWEKDANNGSLRGHMQGDTLIADYTFTSEGVESVREVRFLKNDDMLVEGIGDMAEVNGKMIYKDPTLVRYMGGLVLKKGSCDK